MAAQSQEVSFQDRRQEWIKELLERHHYAHDTASVWGLKHDTDPKPTELWIPVGQCTWPSIGSQAHPMFVGYQGGNYILLRNPASSLI